uniref:Uncharacterized protein n=1 Tax=Arundo donax TaxID=35708 RepID=A0A0A9HAU4_ARUDO
MEFPLIRSKFVAGNY